MWPKSVLSESLEKNKQGMWPKSDLTESLEINEEKISE